MKSNNKKDTIEYIASLLERIEIINPKIEKPMDRIYLSHCRICQFKEICCDKLEQKIEVYEKIAKEHSSCKKTVNLLKAAYYLLKSF